MRLFRAKKGYIILSSVLSSLIFGLLHLVKAFDPEYNVASLVFKAILSISFGVYMTGILMRTGSIIVPALLHGLVNFLFDNPLIHKSGESDYLNEPSGIDVISTIFTICIASILFMAGVMMLNKYRIVEDNRTT